MTSKITNNSQQDLPIAGKVVKPGEHTTAKWGALPDQHVLNAWRDAKLITVDEAEPAKPAK